MIKKVAQSLLLMLVLLLPWLNVSYGGEFVQRIFASRDGLSNGMINSITFDRYGFVWVATEDGLFRVSKTMVRRVDSHQGENRLNDSYIMDVVALGQEYLLVSVSDTLYRYHIPSDTFEEIGSAALLPEYEGGGIIDRSAVDQHSLMLLNSKGQILKLDHQNWQLEKVVQLQKDPDVLWDKLLYLPSGQLIVGKPYHLEIRSAKGEKQVDLPWVEASGQAKRLYRDRAGRVWLTSSDGLFEVLPDSQQILPVPQVPYYITAINEDGKGNLWMASRAGVLKWSPDDQVFEKFDNDLRQLANIDYVQDVAIDSQDLIWLGGAGEGLVLAVDKPTFLRETFNNQPPYSLGNQMIWSIFTEGDRYWFGTDAGIVSVEEGKVGSVLSTPEEFEPNDSVYAITSLNNDYLLLATTNGLFLQDKNTHATKRFHEWSHGIESLKRKWIFQVYKDPGIPGRLWFLTGTGLYYWEPGLFDPQEYALISRSGERYQPAIYSMLRGSDGKLWLGGPDEFGYLDSDGYFIDKRELFSGMKGDLQVGHILEVTPGKLWLGTSLFGVMEYQTNTDTLASLQERWKLSCYTAFGLLETPDYRVILCPRALVRQHKETSEVQVFTVEDGVVNTEFNEGAYAYREDKGLFLGSPNGVRLMDVNGLSNRITDERVFLESVTVFYDSHTEKSLVPSDFTTVAPGARMISLQLTSNDFLDDSPIRLKYRLGKQGQLVEPKYLLLDGQPQLNLSGLDAGRLELELLSRRNEIWDDTPYVHRLHVQQYWWETALFKWSLIVFLMLLTLAIILIRHRQVERFRNMNTALLESEDRLRQSLRGSDSDLWVWTRKDNSFYLDNRNGVLSVAQEVLRVNFEEFPIHPDDRDRVVSHWLAVINGEIERFDAEYRFQRRTGSWGWLRVRGRPSQFNKETGEVEKISGIYSDITQHKQLQNEVDLLAQAFENTSEGVLILDADEQIKVANRAAQSILGAAMAELAGRKFISLLTEHGTNRSEIATLLANGMSWTGERELRIAAGQVCPVWLNVSVMLGLQGKVQHYVVVFSDITERKRSEADLRRLANYDVLTGLPNRSLFAARLNQAIHKATQNDEKLALMFLDLDRFKHVNDSFGHGMGDALLVEAAARLQSCIDPEYTLCRFGGDEFVVLIHGTEVDTLNHLANTILGQIETPFKLFGREFYISTSIGISIWPDDARQPEALIKNADLAMYHAKEEGRGNFQYYSQERNAEALYHLRLEADLRKALERQEFILHYQPQIDVNDDNQVIGMEALLRWQHPKDGFIRTDIFIKVAEACGLVIDIDKWVLRQACLDGARWSRKLKRPFKISVNISAVHFRQPDFIDHLRRTLVETCIPVENLALEITEGVLMKELHIARDHLRLLRDMGVQVAIDDFGTGYSSLAYLRHFDVNLLKIDRSFLIDIADNQADQAIVSSIIELARNLKLKVVAEGIETREQLNQVLERGCHVIQGYYFAKPMPRDDMDAYLMLDGPASASPEQV
ncbi:EAL domain-containing protein [Shewanella litorisediminis]|uniref:EAL domain-containing protein n=1 Tax=Shewanella litorisediminis TaxID=1173586 RepID=A0ABX7G4E1_9GAMM|nr:EAL domain-containing protein [Shewanella litorisediminis]MCL2917745.1 EAL domain-containing protein [Shewanella litorisediminis]QRH02190.1 EAL domain-containing protein [Shewanella litorisediminis]